MLMLMMLKNDSGADADEYTDEYADECAADADVEHNEKERWSYTSGELFLKCCVFVLGLS